MKNNKTLLTIIVSMLFLIGISIPAYAKVTSYDVPVSYTIKEDSIYSLQIESVGDGSVYDGKNEIRNESISSQIKIGEKKVFKISPDNGYKISSVMFNGKEISNQLKKIKDGYKVTISGMATDNTFKVKIIEDINEGTNSDSDNPNENRPGNNKPVQTGDNIETELLWLLILLSLIAIVIEFRIRYSKYRIK